MSETNGNGNGSASQNGSAIEIEPTGKWQVFWVNADGHKTMPASPPGSFRGAVAFCRGWTAGAIRNGLGQIREGLFPVPFRVNAVTIRESAPSILDMVNNHPSRSHVINPALNMKAPLSMADIDRLNAELSQEAE